MRSIGRLGNSRFPDASIKIVHMERRICVLIFIAIAIALSVDAELTPVRLTHSGSDIIYKCDASMYVRPPSVLWFGRGWEPAADGPAPRPGVCAGVIARIAPAHAH